MFRVLVLNIFFIVLNVYGFSQRNFHKQNFAEMYNINSVNLHPTFQCYHNTDTSSIIFYQIDLSELKYKLNKDSIYTAEASIHYEIFNNYKAKELIDSGSVYFSDKDNYGKDLSSFGFFEIPLKSNRKYLILIEFNDINQNNYIRRLIDVDKTNTLSRQNFYIKGEDGLPYLQSYLTKFTLFSIYSERNSFNKIHTRYFKLNNKISKPPMLGAEKLNRKVKSDTLYYEVFKDGKTAFIELGKQGYYHFYFDSTKYEGYTLFQFSKSYPYITTSMQMLMPLRYITSNNEFKSLLHNENKKKAVEDFWVKISGNTERAKNMIKLYYNRVQNANICFTSDKEGWMTDRGMIYIVFGAPDIVYRDEEMETWIYGDHRSKSSMTFDFYRSENPFTSEDFILSRSINYTKMWNNAIEIWRR
jgi:GWxTD domain-containing protein